VASSAFVGGRDSSRRLKARGSVAQQRNEYGRRRISVKSEHWILRDPATNHKIAFCSKERYLVFDRERVVVEAEL
jgi:hypothetical protein